MQALKGVYTALITPFTAQDQLDEEGVRHLIRRQLQADVDGIVMLGTTGEAPTMSETEKKRVMMIAREEIGERATFMVGTGSYATAATIKNTRDAESLGADSALVVIPYYNKPTQEGLYQHFLAIAKAVSIPIVLYNHPGRTGNNLQIETLKRLSDIPNIIGIKETSGNIQQISDTIEAVRDTRPEFSVMSGDDALTLPLMAMGGNGVISVVSNLVPEKLKELTNAVMNNEWERAKNLHYDLTPLYRAAFIETNPIAIKAAMNMMGLPAGSCRLPLCDLRPENAHLLAEVLANYVNTSALTR